jgi:DNA-binding CsgD family transcriptional regulator
MDESVDTPAEGTHVHAAEPRVPGFGFSQSDADRARIVADSIVRGAITVEDTIATADQALVIGLGAVARGDRAAGCHELSRSLIASALAAWQMHQLVGDALAKRDLELVNERRTATELLLAGLPGRVRLATNALYGAAGGGACVAELKGAVIAFVVGSRLWQGALVEPARQPWMRSLLGAFERETSAARRTDVSGLGVPTLGPRVEGGGERTRGPRTSNRPKLSSREREVLGHILGGMTTGQIAEELGVKATTVSTLVGRIFNKLGVNNRPAAVAMALRLGICDGKSGAAA